MFPDREQVRLAAYHRWRRRGEGHGRDLDDWSAAEQDLLFTLNYQVIARYGLNGDGPLTIGDPDQRVCRFCEQAAPRTTFSDPVPVIPESIGHSPLVAFDQCDECRAVFDTAIEPDLAGFHRSLQPDWPTDLTSYVPIAAFKGLTWLALSIMPRTDLEAFPDTIEWVLNPDHDLDVRSFNGLGCYVHRAPAPAPWMTLACRVDAEAPVPDMLFFLGMAHAVVEIALPLGLRDEDRDGEGLVVPRVASPDQASPWDVESTCVFIPMSSARPSRPANAIPGGGRRLGL